VYVSVEKKRKKSFSNEITLNWNIKFVVFSFISRIETLNQKQMFLENCVVFAHRLIKEDAKFLQWKRKY
jgi:hypothetical protein